MNRILILVEGQTEETFVDRILTPYLQCEKSIHCSPVILSTKRAKSGEKFKGGAVSYEKIRRDILNLLKDSNAVAVTTMIDYYGLDGIFPFYGETSGKSSYERVLSLETLFYQNIGNRRFLPYLQLHEFEALVFASPGHIAATLGESSKERELTTVRDAFPTPEEIDDDAPPSKRLRAIFPSYNKVVHGSLISGRIGMDTILHECRHFGEWVRSIKQIVPL